MELVTRQDILKIVNKVSESKTARRSKGLEFARKVKTVHLKFHPECGVGQDWGEMGYGSWQR